MIAEIKNFSGIYVVQKIAHWCAWLSIALLIGITLAASAYAQDNLQEKAQFALHLFQNGQPIEDAELIISSQGVERSTTEKLVFEAIPATYSWKVNSETPLKTDANGSLAGKLPAGEYQIHIKTKDQSFSFDLPLQPAENAQILVTFFASKKKPLLNIESSAAGTIAGTDGAVAPKRDLGNGLLRVQVTSVETGKPVKDVQVFLSGLKEKFRTDEQGMLSATVPVGQYSVSLLHSAYSSQTQDEVKIENEHKTNLNFRLTPAGVELAEFVVLEPHLAGTIASVIEEQRTATSVATVMGAEQFSRAGDSDVAVALRRASGLTLVGGQYIFIRGLGERYSTTLVNGAAVPSPDPTRRVVPLDLFPTNILESVMVQKTYSPDRQAEFAGGTIELRTRGVPDSFFFNLNLQTGVNDRTTFQNGLDYKGSGTDFTGYDNGARALPDALADATKQGNLQPVSVFNPTGVTPGKLETLGEGLSDVWDVNKKNMGPDTGFQASTGNSFSFGDFRLGYIAAGAWKQEFRKQNEINREYQSEKLSKVQDLDVQRSLREVHTTGYAATELEYKDTHKLFARTMFLRQTTDEARISQGFTDAETTDVRKTKLRFFSNQLLMNQFGGEHRFDRLKDFSINWLYTDATANRDEPKTRDYRYDVSPKTGEYIFSQRVDSNLITYADLVDKDRSWRVDGKLPLQLTPLHKVTFSGGMITQEKTRAAGAQRFSYYRFGRDSFNEQIYSQSSLESILNPQYIGANGYQLRDVTRKSDQYTASQNLLMYYGKIDLLAYDKLNITGGLRWEDNDQRVHTTTTGNIPTTAVLNRVDMLPSVVATAFLTDKQQLRAGFSQTISRPDFRELAAAPFLDMNTNQETIGNPFLKQTAITNWDARWEYYLSPTENLFAGFFWKDLQNPIELITLAGNVGLNTYQNIDKAKVYGFEVELLKKLDFIHPLLQNFYFGGNYTWSLSNAKLNAENLVAQTTNDRPLQGHSQHIVNFQLGYDNPKWKTQATLLYNVASQRIMAAGIRGAPDKYEQPFHQLDFVVSQNLYKGLSAQMTMQNLLDDDVLVMQGDEIARQFRRGRVFNLNIRLAY